MKKTFFHRIRNRALLAAAAVAVPVVALLAQGYGGSPIWWEANTGEKMPLAALFRDSSGDILVYNTGGNMGTRDHAFFSKLGNNGRACITCHQPSAAMSVNLERLNERWQQTQGSDAVFAAVDGSNCPTLPQKEKSSHSLLLEHGLFRIYEPWPAAGVKPEFSIEVLRDPTGCNTDAVYGLKSAKPTISVYRRPRIVGNFRFLTGGAFTADSRATTLEQQAIDAVRMHEQGSGNLSAEDLREIVEFEEQLYVAQSRDETGGDLTEVGGADVLGPWTMSRTRPDDLHAVADRNMARFLAVDDWPYRHPESTAPRDVFRESVLRGSRIFSTRTFHIGETANLEHVGGHKAMDGTCATCHNERFTGVSNQGAWADIGTSIKGWIGDRPELPLFKITCNADATPHPYLGRVIYTNDPGRALVTGKCADVGSFVMQQLRGLPARAPYFTAGTAKNLHEVVDFYDKRFSAHFTDQEKQDLVNFMSVL